MRYLCQEKRSVCDINKKQQLFLWFLPIVGKQLYNLLKLTIELEECVASEENVEAILNRNALRTAMNEFLETLSDEKRRIFIERYTFLMPPREIARRHAMTSASVRMALGRMRKALKQYLEEEGLL